MRIHGMGDKAQKAHIRAVKHFAGFLKRSPDAATLDDLRAYSSKLELLSAPRAVNLATPYAQFDTLDKQQGSAPRVMITDELRSYRAAQREVMSDVEHRLHKRLNNWPENSHQPTRQRERVMKRFKSHAHLPRILPAHDPIANLFLLPCHEMPSLAAQTQREIAQVVAA